VAAYGKGVPKLTGGDFENLLVFRTNLRRFLHWSRTQAHAAGLTPAQHQLLVAIKGHPGGQRPTIGDLASYLLLRHHSAVELVDRAAAAGLVERSSDAQDGRVTRVGLTADGEARLATLAPAHLDELRSLAPVLERLVAGWTAHHPDAPAPAADLGLASPQLARAPGPDAPAGGGAGR
jgi:DNA-binding MarR family transcriptional regulator